MGLSPTRVYAHRPVTLFADEPGKGGARKPCSGAARGTGADQQRRILVVEDEWFVAIENEASLRDAKFEVVGVAMSAEEALALAEDTQPDLILMDIRLPGGLDGIEIACILRARFDIPSLFATAHSDPVIRRRAEAARPVGWLTKPFSSSQLVHAVQAALKQRN